MNMQDKEFDELFRSKLEDFEVEPSSGVWPGIEGELPGRKSKKAVAAWLSIAAALLVMSSFGWWLMTKKSVETKNQVLVHNRPVKEHVLHEENPGKPDQQLMTVATHPVVQADRHDAIAQPKKKSRKLQKEDQPEEKSAETSGQGSEEMLASTERTKHDDLLPEDKGSEVKIIADVPQNQPNFKIQLPQPAIAALPQKPVSQKPVKHRIHSIGDLINTVVASVDKRSDKLIEFTDTDDDESNLTGVNLGFVKFKKENK